MAQDPLKPKDDGKIKLPKVDVAMNKVAPADLRERQTKGAEEGPKPKEDDEDKDQKLLERARKRLERAISAESENRKEALEDLKFKAGDQWPQSVIAERNADRRPCHTINKIPTFTKQVTNDLRANRPSIDVSPVGDGADVQVAKKLKGLLRYIQRDSVADIAYDTMAQNAVDNGFGYCRILTEFENANSFNQVVRIKRIRNPFTVYLDPDHQEPDGSDAKWGFVTEMIPRDEFKEMWPDADPMNWSQGGIGESFKSWVTQDMVRIAEYFEQKNKRRKLIGLSNGHVGWEDELSAEVKKAIASKDLEIIQERESVNEEITWYKLTALEILEQEVWPGKWIPIAKMIGDEVDIEGKVKYSGMIRYAKEPQRMYNYWKTLETELIALAPKAPFIGAAGQFEGYEDKWKNANIRSYPYLEYNPVDIRGTPAPPPGRQALQGPPQGVVQAIAEAAQDMMAVTGVRFDATLGERVHDESGKAIKELRRTGDQTNMNYSDNMERTLRHIGNMILDLIPKVYDTKRMLTILREDNKEEQVMLDPNAAKPYQEMTPAQQPGQPTTRPTAIINPNLGNYGVTVTIGPSYATKRIEASESMEKFAVAFPQMAPAIADLIAKNQDWEGAEEIAKRLAMLIAQQHPGLIMPDRKDMTPEVQAMLKSMGTQIQSLNQNLAVASRALAEKDKDRAIALEKVHLDFEAKMFKTIADVEKHVEKSVASKVELIMAAALEAMAPKPAANSSAQ